VQPPPRAAGEIAADLASGEKQGYRFTLMRSPSGYAITAVPVAFGSTGVRTFYSDQSLVIRENHGPDAASASSPEVGSALQRPALHACTAQSVIE